MTGKKPVISVLPKKTILAMVWWCSRIRWLCRAWAGGCIWCIWSRVRRIWTWAWSRVRYRWIWTRIRAWSRCRSRTWIGWIWARCRRRVWTCRIGFFLLFRRNSISPGYCPFCDYSGSPDQMVITFCCSNLKHPGKGCYHKKCT